MAHEKSLMLFRKADAFEHVLCVKLNQMGYYTAIRWFFRAISRLADGVFWYALMLALPVLHGEEGFKAMLHILIMAIICVSIYKFLKCHLIRERPFISFNNIQPHSAPLDRYSFPSGHTMNAFNFAILIAWFYPQFTWLVGSFAALVAISRVILGMHYPTDVLVGMLLGTGIAVTSLEHFPNGFFG